MTPFQFSCSQVRGTSVQRTLASFSALGFAALALTAGAARAQGSDDCNTAQNIGNAFGTFSVDNSAATGSQAASCGTPANDVWFLWTAPVGGSVTVAGCGGFSADSVFAVWDSGACPPATEVGCNDDSCGLVSSVTFTATSGTSYLLQMGGFSGATYTGTFTISGPPVPPANDDCLSATNIGNVFGTTPVTTVAASGSMPTVCATCRNDVWFLWTSPVTGNVTASLCGSTAADTVMGVWDAGTCPPVVAQGCSDDNCGAQSTVTWAAVTGTQYLIECGHFNAAGTYTGTLTLSGPPIPPVNDDCTTPTAISGTGLFPFTNLTASTGTQGQTEAACLFFGQTGITRDVWYTWTAPATPGIATVRTCAQTSMDSKIAVYNGAGCPAAAAIACNDDSCGLQSSLQFGFAPGAQYTIQLGNYPGASGAAGNFEILVGAPQVKLSQVYGGGGNQGAAYLSDFIELYNAAPVTQPLAGWSVQYNSATGTGTWQVTNLVGSIGPGRYYLVKEADGTTMIAGNSLALPTPDATGAPLIAMAAGDAKVALVNSTTNLGTGAVPANAASIVDLVGYGPTAIFREPQAGGTTANNAPGAGNSNAIHRLGCGATDVDNNVADWAVAWPNPRNSAVAANAGVTGATLTSPYFARPGDTVRLTCAPYACGTSTPPPAAAVTADTTLIGGAPGLALLDDGVAPDEYLGDGIYSANATVGGAIAAGTYHLPVSLTGTGVSGGQYASLVVTPAAAPVNDNCATAVALSGAFPQTYAGTFNAATMEYNMNLVSGTITPTFRAQDNRRGVWHTVVGTGNTMTVETCTNAQLTPATDTVLQVLCGTCDGLSVVSWNDDTTGCGGGLLSRTSWCTELNRTYYVWVSTFGTGNQNLTYTLTVTDSGTLCSGALACGTCAPPAAGLVENEGNFGPATNDGCDSVAQNFRDLTIVPAVHTTVRGTARHFGANREIDWYRIQAPTTDLVSITLNGQGHYAYSVHTLSPTGTCATFPPALPVAIAGSAISPRCGSAAAVSFSSTAGAWYGIRVISLNTVVQGTASVFGNFAPAANGDAYVLDVLTGGPPGNDACAAATTLTIGTTTAGTTQNSTNDGSSTCDATGRDVWYSFTLAAASDVVIDTAGSAIDTVLSLYSSCGGAEITCNDDGNPCYATPPASSIGVINLAAGSYRIRVSDKNIGAGGGFNVRVRTAGLNDNCCGALAVAIPSATPGTTVGSTIDAPVPPLCDGPGVADRGGNNAITAGSVWYTVTSPINQTVYADILNASHDSKLSVYTGSCGVFTCVTMNDDINAAFKSKVAWQATAGQTYYVMVHGFGTATGTFTLNVAAEPTPANDLCGSAAVVTGTSGSMGGTLAGATGDNNTITSVTLAACATANTYWDVWYSWTAACNGAVTFATCGTFDTIVSIHSTCPTTTAGNMIVGSCNNDGATAGCAPGSETTLTAVAGTTYLIRVATAGVLAPNAGGGLPFTLTWAQTLVDTDGDLTPDCFDGCPTNPALTAPTTFYADVDGDTYGAGAGSLSCGGAGLVLNNLDCDDTNIAINPAATEVCNGVDDDCDVLVDEGVTFTFYFDLDGDGYGNAAISVQACSQPVGYVVDNTDCDDTNMNVSPGATEVCNGIDDDCDVSIDEGVTSTFYQDADGDGFGNAASTTQACSAPSGYVSNSTDCNDGNSAINPAATEICDGQDNDCDASTDEGFDADGDSIADCFDNCPAIANPTQADADMDSFGDACDNCPAVSNPSQADCDGDTIGDACEGEPDCNLNNVPDSCDIAGGGSQDLNTNGVPDECEGLVAYCFGDGPTNGGPNCPCGNNVGVGVQRGCVNSTGNGAQLAGAGPTSLSGDGLTLTSSSMPNTTSALFIQGTLAAGGGFGTVPFNDGLQCLDGAILRLGTRMASGGVAALGFPGTPISLLGGVGAPGQRFYQVVYRNNAGPCNFLSNSTNGLRVIWTP